MPNVSGAVLVTMALAANLRAYAFHPGTAGKHFFQAAKAIVTKTAPETFGKAQLTVPLRRIF